MSDDFRCPRCGGHIPNGRSPGAYPGALSRTDSCTEVCSRCGGEEGMQALTLGACTPQDQWPVGWSVPAPDDPARLSWSGLDGIVATVEVDPSGSWSWMVRPSGTRCEWPEVHSCGYAGDGAAARAAASRAMADADREYPRLAAR